ncbi:toxin-antitoxin system YwqK family antitoxin [Cystobacter fuscus]|uniref:toxin-antitoxin system YwqK family antitoxin n=1 Tax=Cystobacter fuscus TaxID=43 RepID=UPI0037C05CC8
MELDLDGGWKDPSVPPPPPKLEVRKTTAPAVPVAKPAALVEDEEPVVHRVAPRGLFALGVLGLVGMGVVLIAQAALPERFPSLLAMTVWVHALTGAPSDFFPASAWVLAVLPWGLFALALSMGYQLARRARVPFEQDAVQWVALALLPGLNLVGGPLVLGELELTAESQASGLRLHLRVKTVVAVVLHVLAVVLGIRAARDSGEFLLLAALAVRALSVAAFAVVLFGMGRALLVLMRASEALGASGGKGRGWGSAARMGGARRPLVTAAWAGALGATVVAISGVWFSRREARTCAPGTELSHTESFEARRVSACVSPDGRKQGAEHVRAPNGRLLERGEYREGKRHGIFRTWNEQGVLLEELSYAEGLPDGKWKLYWPDGQRALEMGYVKGTLEGENTTYYTNGNPRYRRTYQKGVVHGRHARWFESGLVEVEGAFNQGRPSGWWVRRNAEGRVVKQWSEGGLSADEETAGVSAVFMGDATLASSRVTAPSDVAELRAGHTQEWWRKRLTQLKDKAEKDPKSAALYALTLQRARANGFVVREKPEGVELVLEPVH